MFQISQLNWSHFFRQKLSGFLSIDIFNSCSHGQRLFERFVKSRIQITFPQLMRRWHSRTFHFDVHGGQFSTYINVRHFEFIAASKIVWKTKSCKSYFKIFSEVLIFILFRGFHEIILITLLQHVDDFEIFFLFTNKKTLKKRKRANLANLREPRRPRIGISPPTITEEQLPRCSDWDKNCKCLSAQPSLSTASSWKYLIENPRNDATPFFIETFLQSPLI